MQSSIVEVHARQILDSRGRPTVEADVRLEDGSLGRAAVPSGASTGIHEARELRDGDPQRYGGLGVLKAVANVKRHLAPAVHGLDALNQRDVDARLMETDGTEGFQRLGANAVLAVSLATCRAAALATGRPLYAHIASLAGTAHPQMPLPMVNILSGGLHATQAMDFQDFLAIPANAATFDDAVHLISRVRNSAMEICRRKGLPTLLADEGGLSPGCESGTAALQFMCDAIEAAGLTPGRDVLIAVDMATSALYTPDGYRLPREGRTLSAQQMTEMIGTWAERFPVASVEDGLGEDDWAGWQALTAALGSRIQLVGDDLFTTNAKRLQRGIQEKVANGILVKFNQNGTLSGTLDVIDTARRNGYATIISARSGETEDPFMADLAVGTAAGQIKIGSLRTSNTLSKYNQLLRIEQEAHCPYPGRSVLTGSAGSRRRTA